jgi:2,4-diketo-3-deoxy-L-fuconate hydrolase
MKLIRFGEAGKEKPGILIGDKRLDMSAVVTDYNEAFFENNGIEKLQAALADNISFPEVGENIRLGKTF